MTPTSIAFLVACLGIAYAGFCRLAHTDLTVRLSIRLAFYLVTVAAIWAAAAVLLWSYRPAWPSAVVAMSTMLMLMATSRAWREGVPQSFKRHK